MSFINSNIIRFHGKSRRGSEDVEIREQILTLQNLHQTYRKNLLLLSNLQPAQSADDLVLLKKNLETIENQLNKLTTLIE